MGLYSGDVQAIVAIVLFFGLAAWAGGMLAALIFAERTEQASYDFEYRPWGMFFLGLGLLAVFVTIGALLFAIAPVRALGAAVWMGTLGIAVVGSGGLFRLIARRVRATEGAKSDYGALARAGLLVTAAEILPFFGWFLLLPFVLIASLGAGFKNSFFFRTRQRVEAPPRAEAQ